MSQTKEKLTPEQEQANEEAALPTHGLAPEPVSMNPSFRREDQYMAHELQPVVMGPPSYASPDPWTNSGALVPVEEHPLSADLSPDYGQDVETRDAFETTMTPEEGLQKQAQNQVQDAPEDRAEWTKKHWQSQARAYGLSTSGKVDELQERVEAFEGEIEADQQMTAAEWKDEIDNAESIDDLSAIGERYDASGADYATVADAFAKREAELNEDPQ